MAETVLNGRNLTTRRDCAKELPLCLAPWSLRTSYTKVNKQKENSKQNIHFVPGDVIEITWSLWLVLVQPLSCAWLSATTWTAARQASLSFTISQNLLKFISIESVMLSNHLNLCRPLLLLHSRIFYSKLVSLLWKSLLQWVSLWIRWPKYWCFSFSHSPSNDYSVCFF